MSYTGFNLKCHITNTAQPWNFTCMNSKFKLYNVKIFCYFARWRKFKMQKFLDVKISRSTVVVAHLRFSCFGVCLWVASTHSFEIFLSFQTEPTKSQTIPTKPSSPLLAFSISGRVPKLQGVLPSLSLPIHIIVLFTSGLVGPLKLVTYHVDFWMSSTWS